MKKADKIKIEKRINNIASVYNGGKFRFRRTNDTHAHVDGWFDKKQNLMIAKLNYEVIDTICHELAHMEQYNKYGKTECSGLSELSGEHYKLTQAWIKDFEFIGITKMINDAI